MRGKDTIHSDQILHQTVLLPRHLEFTTGLRVEGPELRVQFLGSRFTDRHEILHRLILRRISRDSTDLQHFKPSPRPDPSLDADNLQQKNISLIKRSTNINT